MPDRSLKEIGNEIAADWTNMDKSHAAEYVRAMQELDSLDDAFGADTAAAVVAYFLGGAGAWKGPVARRVKTELRAIMKRRGH